MVGCGWAGHVNTDKWDCPRLKTATTTTTNKKVMHEFNVIDIAACSEG